MHGRAPASAGPPDARERKAVYDAALVAVGAMMLSGGRWREATAGEVAEAIAVEWERRVASSPSAGSERDWRHVADLFRSLCAAWSSGTKRATSGRWRSAEEAYWRAAAPAAGEPEGRQWTAHLEWSRKMAESSPAPAQPEMDAPRIDGDALKKQVLAGAEKLGRFGLTPTPEAAFALAEIIVAASRLGHLSDAAVLARLHREQEGEQP